LNIAGFLDPRYKEKGFNNDFISLLGISDILEKEYLRLRESNPFLFFDPDVINSSLKEDNSSKRLKINEENDDDLWKYFDKSSSTPFSEIKFEIEAFHKELKLYSMEKKIGKDDDPCLFGNKIQKYSPGFLSLRRDIYQ